MVLRLSFKIVVLLLSAFFLTTSFANTNINMDKDHAAVINLISKNKELSADFYDVMKYKEAVCSSKRLDSQDKKINLISFKLANKKSLIEFISNLDDLTGYLSEIFGYDAATSKPIFPKGSFDKIAPLPVEASVFVRAYMDAFDNCSQKLEYNSTSFDNFYFKSVKQINDLMSMFEKQVNSHK